ncbi:hypothetical protein [Acinetobacter sp. Ver3]|uniref:hypothetical protein n=1 Tax=Acinetobacter sp. Ver3 TaxID=466088 RepID=UPI00044CEE79|nr:hypothetical protein [Acinetobacter sp. Ver3]EZQ11511.1 hypothetical protein CL42_05035 [Acinetobacter sp. Ver3]
MTVSAAFLAQQNAYFHYEFEELTLNDFPEEISVSLRGMMFRHDIQYAQVTHYIYYSDVLTGDELEKLRTDFIRYCPDEA